MDEQGDIYIACMGGFGYKPIDAGFLRIKKGTTEFDPSYHWVISKQPLEGFSVSPKYIPACRYIGNGKVCAYVFVKESNQSIGHIDLACVPVMMDLKSKTMKRINIPISSGYSVAIEKYKDKVLFGNMNEKDKGIYIYGKRQGCYYDGRTGLANALFRRIIYSDYISVCSKGKLSNVFLEKIYLIL